MSKDVITVDIGRASRAGHSFHERWAACRALQLVFPKEDLYATVRFTYRSGCIHIIGAGYWRKGKKVYEQTKVTISLSSESVAYFKEAAKKHHTQYQKMIRQLLDEYVALQKQR